MCEFVQDLIIIRNNFKKLPKHLKKYVQVNRIYYPKEDYIKEELIRNIYIKEELTFHIKGDNNYSITTNTFLIVFGMRDKKWYVNDIQFKNKSDMFLHVLTSLAIWNQHSSTKITSSY